MGVSSFDAVKANMFIGPQPGLTTGEVFYVNSGTGAVAPGGIGGSNANSGKSPQEPFATIDYAIGRCTASRGDIIYVLPGHLELLTTAGQIALDVAGVSVIGLGMGLNRPRLQYDAAAGSVTVTASNVRWSNIAHVASFAAVDNAIIADATIQNVEIDHCHFTFDATGVEFVVMIKLGNGATDSADYVRIHDNWFEAENIDGCASALLIDDCQFVHIIDNLFTGDYNSVAVDGAAASSACLDYVILRNYVQNLDTGLALDLDDAATGIAAFNQVFGGGALASNVDWGNCQLIFNYVSDAADVSGVEIPTTDAT